MQTLSNICDCHMHIFDPRFPVSSTTSLRTPDAATVSDYKKLRSSLGLARCVVVQPSGYGLDNRCTLDALAQFNGSARGVAVVDTSVSDNTLHDMHQAGIRGIRFNLVQAGATTVEMLEPLAGKISQYRWHIQIHCKADGLAKIENVITRLAVPVVLDHTGLVGDSQQAGEATRALLLRLAQSTNVWLKLSGPYLNSWRAGEATPVLASFVRELVQAIPERLVWGSDWPHVTESVQPNERLMMLAYEEWVGDPSVWRKILCDNPARLYDFPAEA